MDSENSLSIRELHDKRIVIFAATPGGHVPVLLFPNREEFAKFYSIVEDLFLSLPPHTTEIPDVFKQAFYND